jgi:hypothetical protein
MFYYDKYFGKAFTSQGEFEQVIRLLFGTLLTMVPGLIIMAIVYWLMFRFKRPTHPKLNVFHFNIWVVTVLLIVVSGSLYLIFDGIIDESQYYILDFIMVIFGAVLYLVFIGNVILSLINKNYGRPALVEEAEN